MKRTITVEHDGRTFYGHLATIKSTLLGTEDHGILTAFLHCRWDGGGVGVGGFGLDNPASHHPDGPVKNSRDKYGRVGTAYGLDHVMQLMHTVGASRWENLPGKAVIVLFDSENSLGSMSVGIAGAHNDRVLILKDHAALWASDREQVSR